MRFHNAAEAIGDSLDGVMFWKSHRAFQTRRANAQDLNSCHL